MANIKKKVAPIKAKEEKLDLETLDLGNLSVNDLGNLIESCNVELLSREAKNEGFDYIFQNDFPAAKNNMTPKQLHYVKSLAEKTDSVIEGTDGCVCAYFDNWQCQSMIEKLKQGLKIKIVVRGCNDSNIIL